jgi:hypothetical protein
VFCKYQYARVLKKLQNFLTWSKCVDLVLMLMIDDSETSNAGASQIYNFKFDEGFNTSPNFGQNTTFLQIYHAASNAYAHHCF